MQDDGRTNTPRRRWLPRIIRGMFSVVMIGTVVAVAIRLSVRDSIAALAPVYYATPPLVLAVLTLLAAIVFARGRAHRRGIAAAVLTVGLLAWGMGRHVSLRNPIGSDDGIVLCTWNLSHGWGGWADIAGVLAEDDADVIGLVEADLSDEARQTLAEALPDHTILAGDAGMTVAVRGEAGEPTMISLGEGSSCLRLDVRCKETDLAVLLVDIDSNPFTDRGGPIRAVQKLAAGITDRPVVILGDFNTPRDSAHFDDWDGALSNVGDSLGCGWLATWPAWAPVLEIDHIWLSKRLEARRCRIGWSFQSDHRRVIAVIAPTDHRTASTVSP
jgi:endonuclease/exonuclease/phosphatase family metal-dependent hydrolase